MQPKTLARQHEYEDTPELFTYDKNLQGSSSSLWVMNLAIKAGAVVHIDGKRIKWIESLTHFLCHTKADKTNSNALANATRRLIG